MRGGKRNGAGRKYGSKESKPRNRKAIMPVPTEAALEKYKDAAKPLYMFISKYLNQANKKLYKRLYVKYSSPLDCLKTLRDDLMFRYNYARVAEMEGVDHAKQIATEQIEVLRKAGKDKEADTMEMNIKKNKYPRLSKSITELAGEIWSMNEVIDRIESGKPSRVMNIFNIMASKNKAKNIEDTLFKMPKDKDITEAKIIEEENDEK